MHEKYAAQALAGSQNIATPIKAQPTLVHLSERLTKVLEMGHHAVDKVEMATDRLIGSTPETAGQGHPKPEAVSLEQRLHEALEIAERLVNRIGATGERLNSAV